MKTSMQPTHPGLWIATDGDAAHTLTAFAGTDTDTGAPCLRWTWADIVLASDTTESLWDDRYTASPADAGALEDALRAALTFTQRSKPRFDAEAMDVICAAWAAQRCAVAQLDAEFATGAHRLLGERLTLWWAAQFKPGAIDAPALLNACAD